MQPDPAYLAAFTSASRIVAEEDLDAFEKLHLLNDWEQLFFSERFSLYFFNAIDPLNLPDLPDIPLHQGMQRIDEKIRRYYQKHAAMETTFTPTDSAGEKGLKRALDLAAKQSMRLVGQELCEQNFSYIYVPEFLSFVQQIRLGKETRKKPFLFISPERLTQLDKIFELYGNEIKNFRAAEERQHDYAR